MKKANEPTVLYEGDSELKLKHLLATAFASLVVGGGAAAQTQGVSKDEILIGSPLDLSGPISVIGTYLRQGMEAEIGSINAAGGIHGRRLKLIVEDTGYDPRRAIVATRKLVGQDKVFALVGALGSPVVKVTLPVTIEAGVPFLFPGAPLQDVYDPPKKLAFAYNGSYVKMFDEARRFVHQKLGMRQVCVLAQDDDFGEEVTRGLQAGLKSVNARVVECTTFKRGATDFSSQVAKLKSANCDLVVLAAAVKDAANIANEGQKQGWNVPMLVGPGAALAPLITLAGGAAEGIYGLNLWPPFDELKSRPKVARLVEAYEKKHNKPFDDLVLTGHEMIALTAEGIRRAGTNLSADTLVLGLEQMKDFDPGYGFVPMTFTPTQRLGSTVMYVNQVKGGKWVSNTRLE